MSEYLLILLWLAIMALFQQFVNTEETITVHGKKEKRVTWWFAILVFIPLVWYAANRGSNIGDTGTYINTFKGMPDLLSEFPTYYQSLSKDKWFYASEALIHILISKEYKVCFFIIAAFQAFTLIKLYRRYSSGYILAIFIFIAVGDYVSWMQNGTRQFVAVCICLLATSWMIERKIIPSTILILIASRFHGSAILMIPIFLVCIGKAWNKRTLLVIVSTLLIIAFVPQFTSWLDFALDDTQYTNVVSDWQSWNDDGTNPIRVLVYSIPMVLSLAGLRQIQSTDDKVINFCTNMSIVTAGLYLVSMFTSGIFIGRLPIYANLYSNGVLLPWELEYIFNKGSSRYMKIASITGFTLLYLYQMYFMWGLI